jgi:type IV fimbrial biogenesis protein FimT
MDSKTPSGAHGFTLIEVMIALAVLAILVSIAVPAYSTMLVNHRLAAQANGLLTALHLARSEAIKRNGRVVVCRAVAGADACGASGGWQGGWIVFADANNNAALDADETLIRREPPLLGGYTLAGNGPVAAYASYTPMGLAKLTSGAFQAGTWTLCPPVADSGEARQIVLSITGRPRVKKASAAVCGAALGGLNPPQPED